MSKDLIFVQRTESRGWGQQHWGSLGGKQEPGIGRVMIGWSQHSAGFDAILKL